MALKAGIVGLTNVGKTTIFNALTKSEVPSSNYFFATIDPNSAIVNVPDSRVDEIYENITSNKKVYNTLEIVDIAGLVKGASKGEGLGNKFLGNIKEVDAILQVVRCFEDDNVMHVDGSVNPLRDLETIEAELILKDLETVENRIKKNEKLVRANDKEAKKIHETYLELQKCLENLESPVKLNLNAETLEKLKDLNLLTLKPMLVICNIHEDYISDPLQSANVQKIANYAKENKKDFLTICGKIEEEISLLEDDEKKEYMEDYGLTEPGLNKLIKATYQLLGFKTFLTEGEIEVKAWNIREGMLAPQAAGVIHTDFEKKFIKAEVISFEDFKKCGFNRSKAKEMGLERLEGKEYVVQDGDVIIFKIGK